MLISLNYLEEEIQKKHIFISCVMREAIYKIYNYSRDSILESYQSVNEQRTK